MPSDIPGERRSGRQEPAHPAAVSGSNGPPRWLSHPVTIVALYAATIGTITDVLIAQQLPAALLAFLAIPVLFAPLALPRWACLTMTLTVCFAVSIASLKLPGRPMLSFAMAGGMLVAMLVITEFVRREARRRAEVLETSARSDAFYRSIIDLGGDLVALLDREGNTVYRSPAHRRLLGWSDDEHRRHSDTGLHPDDLASSGLATAKALERPGESVPVEGRLRHADGSWRHFEGTISNHLDDPSLRALVVAVRDVTDRREALRALAVSEAHLRTAQGIAQLGSWEWRPNEDRIVWSDQAAQIFGFDSENDTITFAETIESFVHAEDRHLLTESFTQSNQTGVGNELVYRITRIDGELRWIHVISHVDELKDGHPVKLSGTVRDVTEQRLAEIELERHRSNLQELVEERTRELQGSRAALERSERLASLGTLAAGMAHQINNPVGAILLGAELALQQADEEGDGHGELADSLREIAGEAVRCRRIVRSVLKFSRNESTERWEADLRDAIERAGDAVRGLAGQHGAKLLIEPMAEPLRVVMNPIEIEQVLVNLLQNAMQAGPRGVSVELSARRLEQRVRVEVRDDGHGIDPADLERVFEPFFTTRLGQGGTGLGLSVAHGISHDHGGLLEIESAPGNGTRVILDLPLSTRSAHGDPPVG
jgi:PAS domain S-box-containing protein